MEFGIQFFPCVGPDQVAPDNYFADVLELAVRADALGYHHLRMVEHYFHPYGGYSPNPLIFLAAASQRTKRIRLITGAVLPIFNHPLKLAGEIGMVDAISQGRVEIGFARAFLPHEFERFGKRLDDSRAQFDEGLDAVRRLVEDENVAFDGQFHSFPPTTSLPRPTQKPRPSFWVAALATESSFVNAGRMGLGIMAIPVSAGGQMSRLIGAYRDAWKEAGHPGNGRVMIAFHMFVHEEPGQAIAIARAPLGRYISSLVDAASDWGRASSTDYPGYDKIIAKLKSDSVETQVSEGSAWIGTPDEVIAQIKAFIQKSGDFDIASLQVNFNDMPLETASASMHLFAESVAPVFASQPAGV